MNIKNLVQIASNFLPAQKRELLQTALSRAEQALGNRQVNSLADAKKILNEFGVQNDFLVKLRGMASNPLATTLCKMGGIDKNALLRDLDSLQGGNIPSGSKMPLNDDLSRFRAELDRLSKK